MNIQTIANLSLFPIGVVAISFTLPFFELKALSQIGLPLHALAALRIATTLLLLLLSPA